VRARYLQALEHGDVAEGGAGQFRYFRAGAALERMAVDHADVPALQAHVRTAEAQQQQRQEEDRADDHQDLEALERWLGHRHRRQRGGSAVAEISGQLEQRMILRSLFSRSLSLFLSRARESEKETAGRKRRESRASLAGHSRRFAVIEEALAVRHLASITGLVETKACRHGTHVLNMESPHSYASTSVLRERSAILNDGNAHVLYLYPVFP